MEEHESKLLCLVPGSNLAMPTENITFHWLELGHVATPGHKGSWKTKIKLGVHVLQETRRISDNQLSPLTPKMTS